MPPKPTQKPPAATTPKIVCGHCGAEVWWMLPQPDDPCFECGQAIGGADYEPLFEVEADG